MKIAILHNRYKQAGGEDIVFKNDVDLLISSGHEVLKIEFDNDNLGKNLQDFINSIKNRELIEKTMIKINAFSPDIVHLHNMYSSISPSIINYLKTSGYPVVMTIHNYRLLCINGTMYRNNRICDDCVSKIFKYPGILHSCYQESFMASAGMAINLTIHNLKSTFGKIDGFLFLTEFAKRLFIDNGVNPENTYIRSNYVEDRGFKTREKYSRVVVYVGRLSMEKGIKDFIKIAAMHPEILFKVIGDGPLREYVISSRASNILYLGKVDREQAINEISEADFLIFPSHWFEGMPMVMLESLSCGTPVITYKNGGLEEIIINDENGYTADNLENISDQLKMVYNDEFSKYAIMRENSRKSFLRRYTKTIALSELMGVYNDIVRKREKNN